MIGIARARLRICLAGLALLAAHAAAQDEGWVTHDVCASPALDVVARGLMHAEKGTAWLITSDARRDTELHRVSARGPIRDLSFSGDGSRLATTQDNGKVRIHETRELRLLREVGGHQGWVLSVALSPDGKVVASGGRDKSLRLSDVDSGKELWVASGDRMVVALCFLPDGTGLVSAEHQGPIRLWTLDAKNVVVGSEMPLVEDLDVSPDGRQLASVHRNGELRVWDLKGRRPPWTASAFEGRAYDVSFSPDGKGIATCGASPGVRIFDRADGTRIASLETDRAMIAVRWSKEGLVAADYDGKARRWKWKADAWVEDREPATAPGSGG